MGSIKAHKKHHNRVKPRQECDAGKTEFFKNAAIYKDMAAKLHTEADFLMALSAHESGWLDSHNAGLHNLFGLTHGGGNNISFASYAACADYWVTHYKRYVESTATMDAFIAGLRKLPYNDIDIDYDHKLKGAYQSILKWKGICGVK